MREHYGVRMSDLFARDPDGRPRLTWRELGVLIHQLPPGARTRAATGDTDSLWGLSEHLLAGVVDELRVSNWQRGAKKGSRPPKPLQRPGGKRGKVADSPEREKRKTDALKRAAARRAAATT